LGSLAKSSDELLKNYKNLSRHYSLRETSHISTNIFEDLSFLGEFDTQYNENYDSCILYKITNDEIMKIIYEVCPALIEITDAEINEFDISQPSAKLIKIRSKYSKAENIPNLFIFASYHKEIAHIKNAIHAINCCYELRLNFTTNSVNNYALLSFLAVVGKAFTRTNFTIATYNLNLISNNEIQLFLNIRNKIINNEENFILQAMEKYIKHWSISSIIDELKFLQSIFDLLHQKLKSKNNSKSLKSHYLKIPTDNNINTAMRFPYIKNLFECLNCLHNSSINHEQDIEIEIAQ
jgi:hypothetical protein